VIDQALAVPGAARPPAVTPLTQPVTLAGRLVGSRPRSKGSVWYRDELRPPGRRGRARAARPVHRRGCSNVEVYLNGHRIFTGGA
jgi:hypothetical protein